MTVAAPARRAPARKAPAKPSRPSLRVVTPVPSRAPRAPFLLFSLLLVGAGLVGLLYLNTVVAQDAFTLHDLDRSTEALAEREQRLRQEIADLEAPNEVALRARALGLVPAGDPVFVRPDGRVLGSPVPATAPPVVVVKPSATPVAGKPSAVPSAKPDASAKPKPSAQPSAKASAKAKPSAQPKPSGAPR